MRHVYYEGGCDTSEVWVATGAMTIKKCANQERCSLRRALFIVGRARLEAARQNLNGSPYVNFAKQA